MRSDKGSTSLFCSWMVGFANATCWRDNAFSIAQFIKLRGLYSVSLVHICLFLWCYHIISIMLILQFALKFETVSYTTLLFFQTVIVTRDLMWSSIDFRSVFSISAKRATRILIGVVLNVLITLSSVSTLNIWSLQTWIWNFFPFICVLNFSQIFFFLLFQCTSPSPTCLD